MRKQKKEFKIPPVSTLIGSTVTNFFRVLSMGKIAPKNLPKLLLTFLVILISTPFQLYEKIYYYPRIKKFRFRKPPIFIVGHWRSGTTHLHNLMCKDPNHGFVTTYQGVFPNNLRSKWIFKTFMRINIPDKRPADNVKLSPDFPQEEEFALANMTPASFYHYFYFPNLNDHLYNKYVRFQGISGKKLRELRSKYHELLVKAALESKRRQLIVKNPMNTAKINLLLELYPDAKFIHIYRNPIITYLSTVKFFLALLPSTCLQDYKKKYVADKVKENYQRLMRDYFKARANIPKENLYEIKFEEFDEDNLLHMKEIYEQLHLEGWTNAEPHFSSYIAAQKHYKKNKHRISQRELNRILTEWDFAMKELGYQIPENLEIV